MPSTTLSYAVPLPPLPPEDAWFTSTMRADIQAMDEHGAVIATGSSGLVSETTCARSQPLPLPDDEAVQRCILAPTSTETTSDASRAHGQRTFDTGSATRTYVRSDGSCVSLSAIPPLPDFAPDVMESSPGMRAGDPPPSSTIRLPQTGYGARGLQGGRQLPTLLLGALAAIAMCGAAALHACRAKAAGRS